MDITIAILQLFLPLVLLIWQGMPSNSGLGWAMKTVLVLGYLTAIALAGLWMAVPWWIPALFLIIWLVLAIATLRKAVHLPRLPRRWGWIRVGLCGAIAGLVGGLALHIWMGHQPPATRSVTLTFPLRNGTYYIANGGSNEFLNAHLDLVRSKRFKELRGTMQAIDIVKLNSLGVRAAGLSPADPAQYAIFGDPLYAPCAGTVLESVNTMPDMPSGTPDHQHERGNFVLLQCEPDQAVVFMAHLKQGSVPVTEGDRVAIGQPLGAIGNSGESDEPHLHMNAQRPGSSPTALDGDPLAMRFVIAAEANTAAPRYLVRNARVQSNGG